MKKRFLALALTLAMMLSLLPMAAAPALAAESVESGKVRLVKSVSNGFSRYFVFEMGGEQYYSYDMTATYNFHIWQQMNDTDKREAARAFVTFAQKKEAFGEAGAQAVVDFINEKSGWTKAIEKFRWKIENKYNDPELVKAFSDHVPEGTDGEGHPNTKSWYQITMEEQFTVYPEMNDYFYNRTNVSPIALQGQKDISAALTAMEIGHQFYQALSRYRNMAMDIAVKSGSKEIIGIILDRFMFPTAPSGMASALAGATGSLVNELANIYLQVSGIQSAVTESIYGEQPDPSVCLKYANAMADLMEVGCRKALAGARSSWQNAENHARQMQPLVEKFDADKIADMNKRTEDISAAIDPEFTPDTTEKSAVEAVVQPLEPGKAPMRSDSRYQLTPSSSNGYSDFNQSLYDSDRRSYQNYLYGEATKWKAKRDDLQTKCAALTQEYDDWVDAREGKLIALLDDGTPSYSGEYDYRWSHNDWYDDPAITAAELQRKEAVVNNMTAFLTTLKSYAAAHSARAQRLFDSETEKYEEFCKRYDALNRAYNAYWFNDILNIPSSYEWLAGTHSHAELNEMIRLEVVSLVPPHTPGFEGGLYVANQPEGFYEFPELSGYCDRGVIGGKNAYKGYLVYPSNHYSGGGSRSADYFYRIQEQIFDADEIAMKIDNQIAAAKSNLARQKQARSDYIAACKRDIQQYTTARDNYELARKFYLDAAKDYQSLVKGLPDYVKSQYYFTHSPDLLWTEGDYRNPVLSKMLNESKNRPALVKQIGNQLKPLYQRYLRDTAQMKNAQEQMLECEKVMDNYNSMLERYMLDEPELGRDLGLLPVSLGVGPDWGDADDYKPFVPSYQALATIYPTTLQEDSYGRALRLLAQDFTGVSKYQVEAKECAHLLRVYTPVILREGSRGMNDTLEAINTRYKKAVGNSRYYSWVRMGGQDGTVYEPYQELYDKLNRIIDERRKPVDSIGKPEKASLLDGPSYDLTLAPGGSDTLSVIIAPNDAYDKTVIWESRTPEVVSVDQNGRVTALASGTATVVAWPQDSILVPVDTEGHILATSTAADTFGDPVIPDGAALGGYLHVLGPSADYVSAEIEFTVHVEDDPARGIWSRVRAYEDVYDGRGHAAVSAAGLEGEDYIIEYSIDGENWDLYCPTVTDVGTTAVQVRLTPGTLPALPPDAESREYAPPAPEGSGEPGEPGSLSAAGDVLTETFTARVSPLDLTGREIEVAFGPQALVDGQSHDAVIDAVAVDNIPLPADSYTVASGGSATAVAEQSITVTGSGNFTGTTQASAATWRLRKPAPTAEDFTFAIPQGESYTGAPVTMADPVSNVPGMGEVSLRYNGLSTLPVNAGDYAVTLDVAEGAGYEAEYGLALGTLTVEKGDYRGPTSYAYTFPLEVVDTEVYPYPANKDWYTFTFPRLAGSAMKLDEKTVVDPDGLLRESRGWDDGSTTWYFQAKVNSTDTPAEATITVPFTGGANYNDYAVTFTVRSEAEPVNYKASVSYSTYSQQAGYSVSCDSIKEDTPIQVVVGQYVGGQMKAAKGEIITLTAESKNAGGYLDFAEIPGAVYKLFLLDPVSHAPLSNVW